jgi:competence protein ComEC
MRIPAAAIAAAFAGGVLLGQSHLLQPFPLLVTAIVLLLLVLGSLLAWREFIWTSAAISLAVWLGLGVVAACVAGQPIPPEHILSRLSAHQIPQRTPLRWIGTLRNEPSRLPWGYGLDMDLNAVEMAEGTLPVTGGMRIGFTPRDDDPHLPDVHTGDEISALAEARLPLVYKDPGAFDRREFLARQNIHLLATLRASTLLEKRVAGRPTLQTRVARLRNHLRDSLENLFPGSPQTAGILKAMLLGDRSFVDRAESTDFQKTGVYHVLVVAGLHVGALALFLFWLARKLHLPRGITATLVIAMLFAYVTLIEQRAPVLRATLMAAIVVVGTRFYRRLDLLNSAAMAALILLIAKPAFVTDTGFLLSFLAIGAIAGLALPFIQRFLQPYSFALENWRDITRDAHFAPMFVQFRLDFRDAIQAMTSHLKSSYAKRVQDLGAKGALVSLRLA